MLSSLPTPRQCILGSNVHHHAQAESRHPRSYIICTFLITNLTFLYNPSSVYDDIQRRHISRKHTEDSMFETFRADIIIPLFTKVFVLMDTFLAIAEFISSLRSCNNKFQLLWQQQTIESTLMKGNRKAYYNRQVKLSRN
jgi:hypothetical protein